MFSVRSSVPLVSCVYQILSHPRSRYTECVCFQGLPLLLGFVYSILVLCVATGRPIKVWVSAIFIGDHLDVFIITKLLLIFRVYVNRHIHIHD